MSLTPERTAELQELCRQYRIDVLTAIHGAQSGHPGGSLSVCEILTLLYQQRMHVDAAHPDDPDRDRLVLCKGHAAPMLYRNLIGKGMLLDLLSVHFSRLRSRGIPPDRIFQCLIFRHGSTPVHTSRDRIHIRR